MQFRPRKGRHLGTGVKKHTQTQTVSLRIVLESYLVVMYSKWSSLTKKNEIIPFATT